MQLKTWNHESLLYHSCSLPRNGRTFYNSRKDKSVGMKVNIGFAKEPFSLTTLALEVSY